jgi:hypothetical protein
VLLVAAASRKPADAVLGITCETGWAAGGELDPKYWQPRCRAIRLYSSEMRFSLNPESRVESRPAQRETKVNSGIDYHPHENLDFHLGIAFYCSATL